MAVTSAGLLLWRARGESVEVLVGHMGGPFWARKDAGAWSIPKGEHLADEPPLHAALREFGEELGVVPPVAPAAVLPLGEVRQRSGKRLTVFAAEGDLDPADVVPGTFTMEWPPRSGRTAEFPELDRVEWVPVEAARDRLVSGQRPFLDRLLDVIAAQPE